eukprot:CAMPEP_0206531962 /NCGR_PEP_ID=MMETSP0325_2-20121206/4072_1 /ASSEMBLY_ACC=CAM_ASM_000347 /TAXON_ID=2866 /ORGANISM="Crypthecodinium cohnii, Strain Seligo" /LENGTH=347 /DNA_ID=CAMNT_0054028295 /DNA_START=111 /DNA_END=1151 /DNA_ORIENTATION=+
MATPNGLSSCDEFLSSLSYFFYLFRVPFSNTLREAARIQWAQLQEGDSRITEDGGNNPLVELRLDPDFGRAICAALMDSQGNMPSLQLPRTPEQVSFWQAKAASTPFPQAWEELSESTSHFETIRNALAWYARDSSSVNAGGPLNICILGASARYEYSVGIRGAQQLTEKLAEILEAAAPGRAAEFVLCGRDVPADAVNQELRSRNGNVLTRHCVGYLHDLPIDEKRLSGALFIALHSGIGLEHLELTSSWPPTLIKLKHAAPVWLCVSSFNMVEHDTALQNLRKAFLTQLHIEASGPNPAASLVGGEVIGPFDGTQGKRNYGLLLAKVTPPQAPVGAEWDSSPDDA